MQRLLALGILLLAIGCKKSPDAAPDAAPAGPGNGVPEKEVKRVMREGRPAMEKCYDDALARNPNTPGKLELVFAVNADGTVDPTRSGMAGEMKDDVFAQCVLGVVVKLKFPPAGGPTDVQYPLDLSKRSDAGAPPGSAAPSASAAPSVSASASASAK